MGKSEFLLDNQTQAGAAYEKLKALIMSGQLPAGERLKQVELSKELGISVTPVREALRRLAQEGLIDSTPHKGAQVALLSLDALNEIYEMRQLIEPLSVKRAFAKITKHTANEARRICDQMSQLGPAQTAEFIDLNAQFHALLLEDDGSWTFRVASLLQSAAAPYVAMSIFEHPDQMPESNNEHYQLVSAFETGDVQRAVDITKQHLSTTRVLAERYLQR